VKVAIGVVQMDCVLGDVAANLVHIEELVHRAADLLGDAAGAERLIVLPECATTGYFIGDRAAELAEPADGPTNAALAAMAVSAGAHLAVGVVEADGDDVYDSLALFSPTDGLLASYRKVHLFSSEKAVFTVGHRPCLVDTSFGRVGLTICYDLLFPEYVRGLVLSGAELIINGTDWITDPWQTDQGWAGQNVRALCQVRGLENSVHVVMADRTGEEAGFTSLGYSTIAGPTGVVLAGVDEGEGVACATVEDPTADLERWRSYATYLRDRQPSLYQRMGVGPRD
jgi:predicted amidohydrolase